MARGETYHLIRKMTGPRSSTTLNFCGKHYPKTSHTLSGRAADLARAEEDFDDGQRAAEERYKNAQDRNAALTDLAQETEENLSALREEALNMAQEIRDGAQNIEDSFDHPTAQSEAMNETADNLDSWADGIESHVQDRPQPEDHEDGEGNPDREEFDAELLKWIEGSGEAAGSAPELNLTA